MKHVEVEVKYSLPDPETLVRRLAELDAVPLGEDRQVDTYFNAPHRDFLAGEIVSEWLRLRTASRSPWTRDRSRGSNGGGPVLLRGKVPYLLGKITLQ